MPYPKSDHYDGKHFSNQDKSTVFKHGLKSFLKWHFNDKKHPWPKWVSNNVEVKLPDKIENHNAAITFINHASLLIQFKELTIVTDPVFSKRVSPFKWLGPKRVRAPGLTLAQLPKIDIVTVSHNHYDHMDIDSLVKLNKLHQPLFIVPLANAVHLKKAGITNIVELDWWQSYQALPHYQIILTPAQHWSARGIYDRNLSLWGGFIYNCDDLKIYFAGDTGYHTHFKQIFERFGAMDVSLLPIGAYEPRWFMKSHHINPEEAVLAHQDLHARLSIAMHFGTFRLTNEAIEHPEQDLKLSLIRHGLTDRNFMILDQGETFIYQ